MTKATERQRDAEAAGQPAKVTLKTPKGTRDFDPKHMVVRQRVISQLTDIFQRHGAVTIDTPVFELRDVLMGKYGEEGSKLVFDLVDQGGELCSLRYDLTVPFARYLAMNKKSNMKRYQIAKVYRRDQPVMTKGRYREFYQCDFDIAGQYELMVPEAECLKIADEVLSMLDIGDYEIRLNHRVLLEGMFEASGIQAADFKTVCSSVDKLDKQPWTEIEHELLVEKKIATEAIKKLEAFVRLREKNSQLDNNKLLDELLRRSLEAGQPLPSEAEAKLRQAVDELRTLLDYSACMQCSPGRIVFEPSLARGLDYYTGAIYEVVVKEFSFNSVSSAATGAALTPTDAFKDVTLKDSADSSGPIGSVAAGGRYDRLVGMFHEAKKRDSEVPCVGISFGIERLFSIMELKASSAGGTSLREVPTDVFVVTPQKNMLRARIEVTSRLWAAGIRTEFSYKANPKMLNQLQYCEDEQIPLAVIVGEEELKNGSVKVRDIGLRLDEDIKLDDLIVVLKKKLRIAGDD